MYAPIFATLSANADVVALLKAGTGVLRCYPAGQAPQDVVKPYMVFQQITGTPENHLNQAPQVDNFGVQVDIYGDTLADVRTVGKAVRDAIEVVAYVTAWLGESREPDTQLYRLSFETDWITDRTTN